MIQSNLNIKQKFPTLLNAIAPKFYTKIVPKIGSFLNFSAVSETSILPTPLLPFSWQPPSQLSTHPPSVISSPGPSAALDLSTQPPQPFPSIVSFLPPPQRQITTLKQ